MLMALYGYSLQVYADFSGYTDMAIGVALLMGYRLPQNFNSPYKADSCGNFLAALAHEPVWLAQGLPLHPDGRQPLRVLVHRDQCRLPAHLRCLAESDRDHAGLLATLLGGAVAMARIPRFNRWVITNVNIWMTMLLGGLWHGASWNFVIWGGLNGLGITVYKLWRKVSPWETKDRFWKRAIAVSITFHFITFTRIWFRTASRRGPRSVRNTTSGRMDAANQVLRTVGTATSPAVDVLSHYGHVFAVMGLGYAIHLLPSR